MVRPRTGGFSVFKANLFNKKRLSFLYNIQCSSVPEVILAVKMFFLFVSSKTLVRLSVEFSYEAFSDTDGGPAK